MPRKQRPRLTDRIDKCLRTLVSFACADADSMDDGRPPSPEQREIYDAAEWLDRLRSVERERREHRAKMSDCSRD